MTLEGERLLELHSSVSVDSGMSHHFLNQTAVSYIDIFVAQFMLFLMVKYLHSYIVISVISLLSF